MNPSLLIVADFKLLDDFDKVKDDPEEESHTRHQGDVVDHDEISRCSGWLTFPTPEWVMLGEGSGFREVDI